jgi:microsomal dipeptidase-like Zn-dependent dipeptidase
VVRHAVHIARAAGGPEHVGIGTDLDGGFNAARAAMKRTTDFPKLEARLRKQFSAGQVQGIMGGNWLRFLAESLPA